MKPVYFTYHDFFSFVSIFERDAVSVPQSNFYTAPEFHDTRFVDQLQYVFRTMLYREAHDFVLVHGATVESSIYKIEMLDDYIDAVKDHAAGYRNSPMCAKMRFRIGDIVDSYKDLRQNLANLNA